MLVVPRAITNVGGPKSVILLTDAFECYRDCRGEGLPWMFASFLANTWDAVLPVLLYCF